MLIHGVVAPVNFHHFLVGCSTIPTSNMQLNFYLATATVIACLASNVAAAHADAVAVPNIYEGVARYKGATRCPGGPVNGPQAIAIGGASTQLW